MQPQVNIPLKRGGFLTLKGALISHGALRGLRESRFSQDTQQIAYLAPKGACDHAARDCVWERFYKEKREISFSLVKTFSHEAVSNHFLFMLLSGLCGLQRP